MPEPKLPEPQVGTDASRILFKKFILPDPPPDWFFKDRIKVKEFYQVEIKLREKELQIEMERLKALEKLMF